MKYLGYLSKVFALIMILIGILDYVRPAFIVEAMESLNMPLYILWILGTAKIIGGLTLLVEPTRRLTEWAFAGFFIWAFGGISSHILSGHGLAQTGGILVLTVILAASFYGYYRRIDDEGFLS